MGGKFEVGKNLISEQKFTRFKPSVNIPIGPVSVYVDPNSGNITVEVSVLTASVSVTYLQ